MRIPDVCGARIAGEGTPPCVRPAGHDGLHVPVTNQAAKACLEDDWSQHVPVKFDSIGYVDKMFETTIARTRELADVAEADGRFKLAELLRETADDLEEDLRRVQADDA